ncbi:MAG: hypothetical protein KY449_03825 [Proteobacteria bacterium]|nr:hypothetical protein [Pseudomonadota bacterium]
MQAWIRDRSGNVAVMFALAVFMLLALGGGAFTVVRVNAAATRLQDAADGAALAGAVESHSLGASEADVRDAADRWAASALSNDAGFDGPAVTTVALAKSLPTEVTVSMVQTVDTLFAGVIGVEKITLKRRATAVAGAPRLTCLHVLDPDASRALMLQGNPTLEAPNCVVQVNSAAGDGLHAWGSPSARSEATFLAGGSARLRGWSPAPVNNQPQRADPLATRMVWPVPTGQCLQQDGYRPVLQPGHYCAGLQIGRGGRGSRLEPGLYVVRSGGVHVQGPGSVGDGVTIVMLDPSAEFNMQGGSSSLKLSAPTSGPWAGIAVAARPGPGAPNSTLQGDLRLQGTLYLPGHHLKLQGSASLGGAGDTRAVIVRRATLQGAPKMSLAGGYPSGAHRSARLAR